MKAHAKSSQVKSSQVKSVQYLRGIAAIAIVFRHLADRTDKYNIIAPGFNGVDMGVWGVDLFFVISGFVMVYITNSNQANFKYVLNFWLRRYLRISPLYYIMTAVVLFISIYIPNSSELKPSFLHTAKSLLYIPSDNSAPVLGVGWTLNYEMYFYLVFGLVLFLPENYQSKAMSIWLISSVIFGFFYHDHNAIILQITNPLLLEFMLGVFIGTFFRQEITWSISQALLIFTLSCIIIICGDLFVENRDFRFLIYGLPCAGLVSSLIALEAKQFLNFDLKLPLLAGDISYSLYLVHIIAIAAFGKLVMKFSLFNFVNGYVLLFGDFAVCFLIALLIFKFIEQPLHIYFSKQIRI